MTQPTVVLVVSTYETLSHTGMHRNTDYEIYLNDVRLRGFSTHGNMEEGYWGTEAKKVATTYANRVAKALGVNVLKAKRKTRSDKDGKKRID